jgi:serine/threonine protein kinase, bacterial
MTDKKEKGSDLAGCAAILTAIAALMTAIGFPAFFPELVKRIFPVAPEPTPSARPQDSENPVSSEPALPQTSPSSSPSSPKTAIKISPPQFMRNYYRNINENQIDKSWNMLTPEFQVKSSSSYSEFYSWWNSVDQVNVQDISLVHQDAQTAIVEVRIVYIINGIQKAERVQHFTLNWNARIKDWQISGRNKI